MGIIFQFHLFIFNFLSCRQCTEEPSAKNQPDGAGKEASGDKLPTVVP